MQFVMNVQLKLGVEVELIKHRKTEERQLIDLYVYAVVIFIHVHVNILLRYRGYYRRLIGI